MLTCILHTGIIPNIIFILMYVLYQLFAPNYFWILRK